jgi:penicillin-insensitive murein endopeptidase
MIRSGPSINTLVARACAAGAALFALGGCVHAPSPLWPNHAGTVGYPSRGVLTNGVALPDEGEGFVRLRKNERKYAVPRFIATLERAAKTVHDDRPGARLTIGDLSGPRGGQLFPQHASHRTGRDADLLFFLTTLEGAPIESPGFLPVGPDGLAFDKEHNRYVRFDVAREWLLVRTLLLDEEARVQWIFVHDNVRNLLIEWAIARGEPAFLIQRAMDTVGQPHPGGPHDDHAHVRTACTEEELANGCEHTGPTRAWWKKDASHEGGDTTTEELARALFTPMDDGG